MPMLWLYLSNTTAILLSMGLLIPWATIRTVRYRLDHLSIQLSGQLTEFVVSEQKAVAATGEAMSEYFDVDVGI